MSSNSLITNAESIRSNQHGQLTSEQYNSLKDKLSGVPGWFSVGILFALIILVAVLGGKTLTRSTPLAIIALVAVILVTFTVSTFLGSLLARLRIARISLSVEQVPGQVVWKGNRYTAEYKGRVLEPISNLNLKPGDYTFSLLRHTNYLLSAQPAVASREAPSSPAMDINSLKALLQQPLDFDPHLQQDKAAEYLAQLKQAMQNLNLSNVAGMSQQETADLMRQIALRMKQLAQGQKLRDLGQIAHQVESLSQPALGSDGLVPLNNALEQVGIRHTGALEANRAGRQSGSQRRSLFKEIRSNVFWSVAGGIGWLLLSSYAIAHNKWQALLAVTGLCLILGIAMLISVQREMRDLIGGSVEVEEGWVTKYSHRETGAKYTSYYYQLNGNRYQVSELAHDALIEGNYKIYLMPNTRRVVNIEPVL